MLPLAPDRRETLKTGVFGGPDCSGEQIQGIHHSANAPPGSSDVASSHGQAQYTSICYTARLLYCIAGHTGGGAQRAGPRQRETEQSFHRWIVLNRRAGKLKPTSSYGCNRKRTAAALEAISRSYSGFGQGAEMASHALIPRDNPARGSTSDLAKAEAKRVQRGWPSLSHPIKKQGPGIHGPQPHQAWIGLCTSYTPPNPSSGI